ncbi:MAG: radical SAM protein [Turneriella sp.]
MKQVDVASEALLKEKFRTRISAHVVRHASTLPAAQAGALLAQFTPDVRELEEVTGFSDDPLHEEDADIHPFADVVRKYRSKILYLATDECPVYCRYCTRKRKTLLSSGHSATELDKIAAYLGQNPEINEVIFSGGDPLMLPASDVLARAHYFISLPSVQFLRLHSRAVTTSPALVSEKILSGLVELQQAYPQKQLSMVLHINLASELSSDALQKIQALRNAGIPLYAQTVLLKDINDSAEILAQLCMALIRNGVQPYYLHQLDRVTGSAHFEVGENEGRRIYADLALRVPPYMLPRYVRDSKQGKYPLG